MMSESTKMKIEPRMFAVGEVIPPNNCKEGVTTLGPTALISNADSHTPKKKPISVPKSCQKQKLPVINLNRRDDSGNTRKQPSDAPRQNESESPAKIPGALTHEDVQDGKSSFAFQTVGTRPKDSSLSRVEDANLYEEVQDEDRGLPDFPEVVESRNTALDEPSRGETCGKNPVADQGRFSAKQGQRQGRIKQIELHNKSSSPSPSSKAVSATEKISRILLMESELSLINKAAGKLSSKTKEENKVRICKKSEDNIAHSEDHLYNIAKDVDQTRLEKSNKSELLYDGIVLVNSLDSTQNRGPICNKVEVRDCVREQACTEEPLYAEVTNSLEEPEERKEQFYDKAIPFAENVTREPAVKPEESFYDEISLAESNSAKERTESKQPLYDVASMPKRYRKTEQAEHSLYWTPLAVKDSKLPRNARLHNRNQTLPRSCPGENPYCLAASVHENFSDGSSDEGETLMNRIVSRSCESLEKKAYRLRRLWGDEGPCAKPTTKTRDEDKQLIPVKSERKVISVDCDECPEDIDSNDVYSLASHAADIDHVMLRKWIVMHILDTERVYVGILDLLFEHMQKFKSLANTDQSVIEVKDNAVIFYKISELHKSHLQFIVGLARVAENWLEGDQEVGPIFQKFVAQEYALAREYLKNYDKAVKTVQRCSTESPVFAQLTKAIPVKFGGKSMLSLEELLYKLVVRFRQNTLSMKDLINSTPLHHPDYEVLQRVLKFALNCLQKPNDNNR